MKNKFALIFALSAVALSASLRLSAFDSYQVGPYLDTSWQEINYFMPPHDGTDSNEGYPCGDVPVSMAQLVQYLGFPRNDVGTGSYPITVEGVSTTESLLGGNGHGGAYQYSDMPREMTKDDEDEWEQTNTELDAVSRLMHDCATLIKTDFQPEHKYSTSDFSAIAGALTGSYAYGSSIYGYYSAGLPYGPDDELGNNLFERMVNPCLDAGRPVLLGFNDADGGYDGFAFICDGYRVDSGGIVEHHLIWPNNNNIDGGSDGWFQIENLSNIKHATYNVMPSGQGEIISGRVYDADGTPQAGVQVTAESSYGTYTSLASNSEGVYALIVPSGRTYSVSCQGYNPYSLNVGISGETTDACANVWRVDFPTQVEQKTISATPESLTASCGEGQSPAGDSFTLSYDAEDTDETTYAISIVPESTSWLSLNPTSGSLTGGSSVSVSVSYDAASLSAGTYKANISITAANAVNSLLIPVTLTVSYSPLKVNPSFLRPVCAFGGTPAAATFQVWNDESGTLSFNITDDASWMSVSPSSGSSTGPDDKETITVSYTTSSLAVGEYSGTITIDTGDGLTATVKVTLTVGAKISTDPDSFSITAQEGDDAGDETLAVWNGGGGTLSFSATIEFSAAASGWMSLSPTSGTSTGSGQIVNIAMSFTTSSLAVGTYQAEIVLTDSNAIEPEVRIPVYLNVVLGAIIDTSETEFNHTVEIGVNPDNDSFEIWNDTERSSQMNYQASVSAGWLSVSPSKGDSVNKRDKDTITVSYSVSTLSAGTYTANITISSLQADNTPYTIPVSLQVGPQDMPVPNPGEGFILAVSNGSVTKDFSGRASAWLDGSGNNYSAIQPKSQKQPLLVETITDAVPHLAFDGKSNMFVNSAAGINSGGPYEEKSLAFGIMTGDDIFTRQVIFEQGDRTRGMSVYLDQGLLYFNVWNLANDQGDGSAWGPIYLSTSVAANTYYAVVLLFDAVNERISCYVDGQYEERADGVAELYGSSQGAVVCGTIGGTRCHDNKSVRKGFMGFMTGFYYYGRVLDNTEINNISAALVAQVTSFDTVNQYDLWLRGNAGVIVKAVDGNNRFVQKWADGSPAMSLFSQGGRKNQPLLFDSVAAGGDATAAALVFDGEKNHLKGKNSAEINSSKVPYSQRTMFVVFKTGLDITSSQIVWNEGNKKAGLSVGIDNGSIVLNAWNLKAAKGTAAWGPVAVSAPLQGTASTHCVQMVLNEPADALSGFLNGAAMGTQNNVGKLAKHSPAMIGAAKKGTMLNGNWVKPCYFNGSVFEVIMYNRVLTAAETALTEDYLATKYGLNFE